MKSILEKLAGLACKGTKSAWIGFLFALAIIPADIRENLVMRDITSTLERGQSIAESIAAGVQARTGSRCVANSIALLQDGIQPGNRSWTGAR
jgi:hypothetical protein